MLDVRRSTAPRLSHHSLFSRYFSSMPPVSTPAIVLHTFKYSESSKVVRLLTRDLGLVSAVAKGASKPKSKFGARLQVMSDGIAQLYMKHGRDLNTLAEFESVRLRQELAADIRSYASASALAELVMRFAPAEPHEETYVRLEAYLDSLCKVQGDLLETTSISAIWGIVCALGFEPSLDGCARDGRAIDDGPALFSVADGGLLCSSCAGQTETARSAAKLQHSDRLALDSLIAGRCSDVGVLSERHAAAHRRLLVRFVLRHVSEDRDLKALDFWESIPWGTSFAGAVPSDNAHPSEAAIEETKRGTGS